MKARFKITTNLLNEMCLAGEEDWPSSTFLGLNPNMGFVFCCLKGTKVLNPVRKPCAYLSYTFTHLPFLFVLLALKEGSGKSS